MIRTVAVLCVLAGVAFEASGQMKDGLDPRPNPDAVILSGNARFTILTPAMIRMEWSAEGVFEDRASQAFINRRLPAPTFEPRTDGEWLVIDTGELVLRHKADGKRLGKGNLSVSLELNGRRVTWKPGTKDTGNLLGTWRTLDGVSGDSSLEPGLVSRDGWVVVDDSKRLVFDEEAHGRPWLMARENSKAIDWYFFGYGHDYTRALHDFTKVAGRIPLPPRYVFGAWWSRYWAYSDAELKTLVQEFDEHDVPLDVLVVDMDWHLDGWTGYTWNPEYFPDPDGFMKWVEDRGLRTTFNLHPADGVGKHETAFPKMAEAMGLDPATAKKVPFDCTDPKYMDAYFELLHRPMERQGVDFWWIDWQQGSKTKTAGLDPLWWLNTLHWKDMEDHVGETGRRPLIFSRWGGLGNHRYQLGFSGDTFCNWPSLAFQPFFTSTAGNVGFAYWSHDIGGHQPGPVDPELYARWIQYGIFSPVLRTHTTKNPLAERRIWAFPENVFDSAKKAFHLRYELIPYIYTAARKCYDTAVPLCRPLYYEWPELDEAYEHGGEYLFGDDLLVAPVTEPMDPISRCAQVKAWLPPGEWTNWYTGRTYEGPGDVRLLVALDEIPLFVRSGAIIPAQPKMNRSDEKPVDPLVLHIWPGESGKTRIYEDDGTSAGYQKGECAWTPVSHKLVDDKRIITIGPVEGTFAGMPAQRQYEIRIHDCVSARCVTLNGVEWPLQPDGKDGWTYDTSNWCLRIRVSEQAIGKKTEIVVEPLPDPDLAKSLAEGLRGVQAAARHIRQMSTLSGVSPRLDALLKREFQLQLPASTPIDGPGLGRFVADNAAFVGEYAVELADAFASVGASERQVEPTRRALARLHGLFRKVCVTSDSKQEGAATVEIELAPTISLSHQDNLRGSVRFVTDDSWRIEGEREWKFDHLSEATPFQKKATLVGNGTLRTGVLKAEVRIGHGTTSFDLSIEKVFLPSINAWWIVGPFGAPMAKGLDTPFPPDEAIDLKSACEGKGKKKIGWKVVKRSIKPGVDLADEFFVDFDEVFGGRKYNAVAYAFCYLHAPRAMEAVLAMGTDDGVVVRLNGEVVHRYDEGRAYTSKEDRAAVMLKQGANTLLLKINQGGGDWGFCVHVEDADGRPLPEVRASLIGNRDQGTEGPRDQGTGGLGD